MPIRLFSDKSRFVPETIKTLLTSVLVVALLNIGLPLPARAQEVILASGEEKEIRPDPSAIAKIDLRYHPGVAFHRRDILTGITFFPTASCLQDQSGSSSTNKGKRGIALAIAGLGAAAAGGYLMATGFWVSEGHTSTQTSCTTFYYKDPSNPYGLGTPYQSCIDFPVVDQMPKSHTAVGSAGIALTGAGVIMLIRGLKRK